MQDVLEKFLTASVLFMPRVLGSLAILAAFWIAAIVLQALVVKIGTAGRFGAGIVTILRQLVKGAALAFGVVTALGTSGFNVSALVAGLRLSAFVLGFAVRRMDHDAAALVHARREERSARRPRSHGVRRRHVRRRRLHAGRGVQGGRVPRQGALQP